MASFVDGDAEDASVGGGATDSPAVQVTVRVINLCAVPVDLAGADEAMPVVTGLAPLAASQYVPATVRERFVATRTGESQGVRSWPQQLGDGDRVTVVVRGASCQPMPLVEGFAAPATGTSRLRFVDTAGQDTPTRLFVEGADGLMHQLAAVAALGDSGPAGVLLAAPTKDTQRIEVGPELSGAPGVPGYELPSSSLGAGQKLFLFHQVLSVVILDEKSAVAEVKLNPSVALVNGLADACGTGAAHLSVGASGQELAAVDVRFGLEARIVLPPTTVGYPIVMTPSSSCTQPGASGRALSGPLGAGGRYLQLLYGSATAPRTLLLDDHAPHPGPQLGFFNGALGAPAVDLAIQTSGDPDGGTELLSADWGAAQPSWQPAPAQDFDVFVTARPTVRGSYTGGQAWVLFLLGDFGVGATAPARLLAHHFSFP